MAFIISKRSIRHEKSRELYYFVENYRVGNKIRRITLATLGENPNLSLALEKAIAEREMVTQRLDSLKNRLERVKRGDLTAFLRFCPGFRQQSRITYFIDMAETELVKIRSKEANLVKLIKQYPVNTNK